MNRRRGSLSASPTLIGAATVLVALVAVVLAYNANKGLPFIRTYDINANVADAKKLTTGVDVRIGGKRVGQVLGITAVSVDHGERYHARLKLKLDQAVAQLPVDTRLRIQPRSVIGTKFVELLPGTSKRTIKPGGTIQEAQTSASVDLDEITGLFDASLRRSFRSVVKEAANAVAGRGPGLNQALSVLPGVLDDTTRLLQTVSDPRTDLGGLIEGADAATRAIVPVRSDLGRLLAGARVTLGAIAAESPSLGAILRRAPGTLQELRRTSHVLRPVLRDAAALARELRPGLDQLPATVKALHGVAVSGIPVLNEAPVLGQELQATLVTLDATLQRQTLKDSLNLLTPTANELLPTLQSLVPMQTRCNYVGLFARNATSVVSEGDQNGNYFRLGLVLALPQMLKAATPAANLHYQVYPDAVPNGCAIGNEPYSGGSQVGAVPGQPAVANPSTSAPPGTPKGPR